MVLIDVNSEGNDGGNTLSFSLLLFCPFSLYKSFVRKYFIAKLAYQLHGSNYLQICALF